MRCEQVQTRLADLTLSQLQAGKYTTLHRHIAHCPDCQRYWQQWVYHETALAESMTTTQAPPTLEGHIMAAIQTQAQPDFSTDLHQALAFDVAPTGIQRLVLRQPEEAALAPDTVSATTAPALLSQAHTQLDEYFRGERTFFRLPIDLSRCTDFERAVLDATAAIPYGEVRSYAWIATHIGRPKAMRAVGNALHKNPVPIIIPCHRVVKSDGSMGGYAFGTAWKTRLLSLEQRTTPFIGCSSTRIICYRGCHHERRIREGNRIHFASIDDAYDSGYRACTACQPV